jgi:UDP-N-acetylglucosamine 2-epimerase (non-hydrolysing)
MGFNGIVVIVGTRPEAIKVWPILTEARARGIAIKLISTQQQQNLLEETLDSLSLEPEYHCKSQHFDGQITSFLADCCVQLTSILKDVSPRIVLVQGDTSSAVAGAIAAHNLRIPIGHIEAGLRSHDLQNPWPEEGNRRIIDAISKFLWVPTNSSLIPVSKDQQIVVVGNTSIDSLRLSIEKDASHKHEFSDCILVTLHRRESFGERMTTSLKEIKKLSQISGKKVVFIEHPNPNVRSAIDAAAFSGENIKIIAPVPYQEFIQLMSSSLIIISDSGGIQEEATALGKPLLVVREKTERVEVSQEDPSSLVGADGRKLVETAMTMMQKTPKTDSSSGIKNNLFGDGYAAQRILDDLAKEYFTGSEENDF